MTLRKVSLKPMAQADIRNAITYYGDEASAAMAQRFADAVALVLRRLGSRSAIGSPRYAHELKIPQLRTVTVKRFPYLVFYMEDAEDVDVVRVLHAKRDLSALLSRRDQG